MAVSVSKSSAAELEKGLLDLREKLRTKRSYPLSKLLPLVLQLRGSPYSLNWSHFMFEPMFRIGDVPRQMVWRTGRQVAKSTGMAASQIIRAITTRDYNILTVMPLYEQVRKFSTNYVRPFLITSGIKSYIVGDKSSDSVLQRALGRNSNLYFSYSSGDPNRVRGIPADELDVDEVQDMDMEDLPIIEACMDASRFKILRFTGTPKTFDNTIHLLFEDSSQAHWHIPCTTTGCKHENRCDVDGGLLDMIDADTLVCRECGKPLNSRLGYFVHDYPSRRAIFPGYHVPQPILPMHYESPQDWYVLKETQRKKPTYAFMNEVLGESYDLGAKVITEEEVTRAAQAEPCMPSEVRTGQYIGQVVGVDWGGRGKEKITDSDDFISNTALSLCCLLPNGKIEVRWLHKVPYAIDLGQEASIAVDAAVNSHSDYIAMDYGGQGNVQEQLIKANSWPQERIVPFSYAVMRPSRPIVFYEPPKHHGVRSSYTLDKPRSILLLCELIKRGWVILPKSDVYINDHLRDFLAIYEESIDNPAGSPKRLIKRMVRRTDDIVHSINFAVMALYHASGRWPDIAEAFVDDPSTLNKA